MTLGEVFRFELGYRLRQPSTWTYASSRTGPYFPADMYGISDATSSPSGTPMSRTA